MIRSNAGRYPVSAQCRILDVAKSTYYWMLEHPEAERTDPHEADVERVWRDSGGGVRGQEDQGRPPPRAYCHVASPRQPDHEGRGMTSSYSKAAYRPHPSRPNDDPAPNLLARESDGYRPRTHLASDLTYVRVGNSWAYICPLIDLANREIAGHSVGVKHDPGLVLAAFATLRFPLDEIEVLHTDRGGEFTGGKIERMLDTFGIARSLSRPGTPHDNAVVESANRIIKKELIYKNTYTSVDRLRSDVNRYMWWYNHQRLHSTLDYMSPVEFTKQGKTL